MYIYIMRHATAENLLTVDEERALVPHAMEEIESTTCQLKKYTQSINWSLFSPFRRAIQTHQIVNTLVEINESDESNQITPSGDPRSFRKFLDLKLLEKPDCEQVLIVSHLPFVSYLLDELVNKPLGLFFPPASIAVIDYDATTSLGAFLTLIISQD